LSRTHLRYLLAGALTLAIGVPSVAIATGERFPIDGGTRNPTPSGSDAYTVETEIISDTTTYGTRQSNKRVGDGGGAIYGCRSAAGNEPCLRSNNLNTGRAFEFATSGKEAGRIELADTTGAPFTTNAKGVATGLNSDQVDGKEAADFAAAGDLKAAAVDEKGVLGAKRGATAAAFTDAARRTFTVTFDADVSKCFFTASPTGASAAAALGTAIGADPKTVLVDQPDDAEPRAFHLQVVCESRGPCERRSAIQRVLDRGRAGRQLGREALEQQHPRGVQLGGAADGVRPAVEVARLGLGEPRPEEQLVRLGRQLGRVAVQLAGAVGLARARKFVGLAGERVGALEAHQPAKLADRVGVVLDAQVEQAPPGFAAGGHDHQRRGLAAAHVAPRLLGRLEGDHQALGQIAVGGVERRGHGLRDAAAGHHVRLAAVALAGDVPGVRNAVGAGVHADLPLGVDDGHLPVVAQLIAGQQLGQRRRRALPGPQALEQPRPVGRLGHRLRGHGTDTRLGPRHDGAHREPVGLDGHADQAGGRVAGDDRVGALTMGHAAGHNSHVESIRRSSDLPIPAERVKDLLLKSSTFVFVTWPLLAVSGDLPEKLTLGARIDVRLWLFSLIPLNRHVIEIVEVDEDAGIARTREHGGAIKRWNHTLRVEPTGPDSCRYTDEVEIDAGSATPVVAAFARVLFAYRHSRWRQLAKVLR
jgi:hypothetical protein